MKTPNRLLPVLGLLLDLATGKVTNLTNSPGEYDELEGIYGIFVYDLQKAKEPKQ